MKNKHKTSTTGHIVKPGSHPADAKVAIDHAQKIDAKVLEIEKTPKKLKIITIIVLSVLVLLSGAWLYLHTDTKTSETPAPITQADAKNKQYEIVALAKSGSKENAQSQAIAAAEKSQDKNAQSAYYVTAAEIAINNNDLAKAEELALKAEAAQPTDLSAVTLGYIYKARGDTALAVKYFTLAADRVEKTTDPTQRSPYNDYMNLKKQTESL